MGVVYQARDTQLGRIVALKVLPAELARDSGSLARFEREARLLASLNDPRIATLHSLEESEGFHFLTMEFVEGRTLKTFLTSQRPSIAGALEYCAQVAAALAEAHRQGVIHRDLKPANIMVTPAGKIKILDFGIAKALDQASSEVGQAGTVIRGATILQGTPGFMSPEQIRGETADHRCDIWAFGCVLYECLSGEPAFLDSQPIEAEGAPASKLGPDLEILPRGTSRSVRSLLRSCLAPDVNRRLESATKAEEILRSVIRERHGRKRRLATVGFLLLLLFLTLLATGVFRSPNREIVDLQNAGGGVVVATGADSKVVWSSRLPTEFGGNWLRWNESESPTIVRDNSKPIGVVLPTESKLDDRSRIWYLDAGNGKVLWSQAAEWETPLSAQGQLWFPWNTVLQGDPPIIVASLVDGTWYNAAIRLYSLEGNVLGTYYHPGPLKYHDQVSFDGDDRPSILLSGVNSSARFIRTVTPFETAMHPGCIVLIQGDEVTGQAFPYSAGIPEGRDWPGMQEAQEHAYLLVPLIHPSWGKAEVGWIDFVSRKDGSAVFQAVLRDGRVLDLDRYLMPTRCYLSAGMAADSLRVLGEAMFPPFLHIRNGEQSLVNIPIDFDE
ncbi:MAG: serine/threonine protein kinase [Candidatus Eisenbacteria sp.]|nr:serine/threonine protein kinase [Candidatus Eisenbacteria bacterium]